LASYEIQDETIEEFEAALIEETLHRNPSKVAREAVLTWNKMRGRVAGWPDITLTRTSSRVPWTIPLDKFPAGFQADVDAWCRRMAMTDLFDEDAPVRASRPATIKHRRFQIRMMASAIVLSGVDISKITGLRDIVEVENFRLGIRFMIDRGDGKITEAIFGLASGIKAIARHHVKIDDLHLERLKRLCSRLDQQADRYRKKNKERLAQFDDRRNLALLMHLPDRLRALSMQPGPKPRSAALYMQSAVAIEILIMCPMRIGNLVNLDINRHLRWIKDKGKRRLVITIPGDEVKNGSPLRYELEGTSAVLVSEYMERARLELCSQPSTALFPRMNGGPRNPGDLSQQIKRHFFEQTGLVVNAHLFRSLAGKIHNLVNAGDAATISHVLGDRIGTVMKSYTQFEQKAALDHYQSSVNSVRGDDMMGSA
jgi:integrase